MPNPILTDAIDRLVHGEDLTRAESAAVLRAVMSGESTDVETAGFLIALRSKGETVHELAGLAETMRSFATTVHPERRDLVDTAGTGGGRSTFNISTTAALIAAGAGCAVAKHGNRSATSRSGSADVLEALGARIDLTAAEVAACIDETGFGFMFAPAHHAATRFVVPVRRELAVRTVFNVLGPLTNPAAAKRQLVGVVDRSLIDLVAGALAELGCEHALVVSSEDGLDEMSAAATTAVAEVRGGEVRRYDLEPADAGLDPGSESLGPGGSPEENAAVTRSVLDGTQGPRADTAVLNAAAAIHVAGRADTLADGVAIAREAIASGAARDTLDRYIAATHSAGAER
ncbi:MAG: anthranilate phosphoribosyltransferase [Baekduia sp.]